MNNKKTKLSGIAPYLGGKRKLASRIVPIIEETPHYTYAEPFIGMGGIFFRRHTPAKHEVINDLSDDVFNLFRVAQRHPEELLRVLRFAMSSRKLFTSLVHVNTEYLTDVERAARFFYLQKTAFGGKITGRAYGVDKERSRFNIRHLKAHIYAIHERLEGAVIECLPYQKFIVRYDATDILFYLDPPYYGNERDYGDGMFSRKDFQELSNILSGIKGKFLISINDVPEIREIFAKFHIYPVQTTYSISCGRITPANELIIANYDLGASSRVLSIA